MKKIRIGIVTIYDFNLGNRLQNYAMQKILCDYGEVYTIKRPYSYDKTTKDFKYFVLCILRNIKHPHLVFKKINEKAHSKFYKNRELRFKHFDNLITFGETFDENLNLKELNNKYDFFVAGSDQIRNPNFFGDKYAINLLSFADNNKRIAVSPSIAVKEIGDDRYQLVKENLLKFKCLSCREEEGSKLIQDITGRECLTLLDPTLMLDASTRRVISEKPYWFVERKFIVVYILGKNTKNYEKIISQYAKKYKVEIIDVLSNKYSDRIIGPKEFIYLIDNCEFVLTDSYHASIFSVIFNKPFKIFKRVDDMKSMDSRIDTLVNIFEIKREKIDAKNILVEFNETYNTNNLKNMQKEFLSYLNNAFKH